MPDLRGPLQYAVGFFHVQNQGETQMVSYRRKLKTYKLVFEGEHEGLVVHMRGLTTGEFLEIISRNSPDGQEDSGDTVELLQSLADHLISWNMLDDDDQPVPANFDGVKSNDMPLNMKIIDAWTGAVSSVAAPLPESSPSGEQFPVVHVPTEVLSASPLS